MSTFTAKSRWAPVVRRLDLARVLLVEDQLPSRLALQTILQAGGYSVDVAASSAEALAKLDKRQYELVLSDLDMETPAAGLKVLSYARVKDYRPATALITAYPKLKPRRHPSRNRQQVSIETKDVSNLLSKVADLIAIRATRRAERALRQATI